MAEKALKLSHAGLVADSAVLKVPVATATSLGKVKPDGVTITVNSSGVISALGGGSAASLENRVQRLELMLFNAEVTANPWMLDLTDSDGWTLLAGIWDQSTGRVHG